MGFDIGALKNTLHGSGKETLPIELGSGEFEKARVVASRYPGGLKSVGGDLVLTSQRLVFTPLNVKGIGALLSFALAKAGAPKLVSGLPDMVVKAVGGSEAVGAGALAGIASAEAGSGPRLLKPPTIVLTADDGRRSEVGILAARRAPNLSAQNRATRDEFLARLRQAIASG